MPTPTPAELRSQAPVVGSVDDGLASQQDLDFAEEAVAALAPVLALLDEPATNLADVTGGAATTDTDVEARAGVDALKAVLVDAGLMAPEEE